MRCNHCLKFFNDFYGFCPYCGTKKIDYNLYSDNEDNKFKSELFNFIGKKLVKKFKDKDALGAFNESLKFNNKNIDSWRCKAKILNNDFSGTIHQALDCIENALNIDENDLESLVIKGKILKELNEENSQDYFKDILDKCMESDETSLIARGDVLYELNEKQAAIDAYTKALEINPLNAITWEKKGKILCYMSNYDEGTKCLRKALEIDPYDIKLWRDLALYCKTPESEINAYMNSRFIFPKSTYEWRRLADKLKEAGEYEKAIECYDKEMELCAIKTSDNSYISQGKCYEELENYEKAIECYDNALNIWSDDSIAIKYKSDCYFKIKEYQKALDGYEFLISEGPNFSDVEFLKGKTLLKIDKTKGKTYLKKLLEKSDSIDTKSKIYYELGEYDLALEHVSKAINEKMSPIHYYYSLKGAFLYDLGKKQEALHCFNNSLNDYQTDYALYYKGIILDEFGDYDSAIDCFDKLLKEKPYDKKFISKKEEIITKNRRKY